MPYLHLLRQWHSERLKSYCELACVGAFVILGHSALIAVKETKVTVKEHFYSAVYTAHCFKEFRQ